MATVAKPPRPVDFGTRKSVFLAGTIDNGNSVDWQAEISRVLDGQNVIILNPQRDEWDPKSAQSITNPLFKEQVEWELVGLEAASLVFMYFAPGSSSPITLLELGLLARSGKLIVVAPDGYWRKGNIEVTGNQYGFPVYGNMEQGIAELKRRLAMLSM